MLPREGAYSYKIFDIDLNGDGAESDSDDSEGEDEWTPTFAEDIAGTDGKDGGLDCTDEAANSAPPFPVLGKALVHQPLKPHYQGTACYLTLERSWIQNTAFNNPAFRTVTVMTATCKTLQRRCLSVVREVATRRPTSRCTQSKTAPMMRKWCPSPFLTKPRLCPLRQQHPCKRIVAFSVLIMLLSLAARF